MNHGGAIDVMRMPCVDEADRSWSRRFVDWVVDARAHRVLCLLGGVWLISAFDIVLTVSAHRLGLLDEENPIAARLLLHSPYVVLLYKSVLVAFASTVLVVYRRQLLAEIVAGGILFIYGLVAIQWRLCYEFYLLTRSNGVPLRDIDAIDLGSIASDLTSF